jgi:hypothetical protein
MTEKATATGKVRFVFGLEPFAFLGTVVVETTDGLTTSSPVSSTH